MDVEVYAVADSSVNEEISGLDMVIIWDSNVLGAVEVVPGGGFNWNLGGNFMDDSQADNLNERLKNGDLINDGDAYFQGATFSPAIATPEGLLVTTLRFSTMARGLNVPISIVESLGTFSRTKVLEFGSINKEITGTLGTTSVGVICPACMFASDIKIPAGRLSNIIVSGEIFDQETIGVTVMVELIARVGNSGTVEFTNAPPTDIMQWGDPWPNGGFFSPFDTDSLGLFSSFINGSVDDNGSLFPSLTTYGGPLAGFPIVSSVDASGVWDVMLTTSNQNAWWEGVDTTLISGTIEIVDPDVAGGHDAIDVLAFADLQLCYTGAVGPVQPPAYEVTVEMDCGRYDYDSDGDVDGVDYEEFHSRQNGPDQ